MIKTYYKDLIIAFEDVKNGLFQFEILKRLSFGEIKRRYRRTLLGPIWISLSLALFSIILSIVWSKLWGQNVKEYLPYLLAGMIPWTFFSTSIAESCQAFQAGASLMLNKDYPYSRQIYIVIGRNLIIFGHNLIVYAIVVVLCQVQVGLEIFYLLLGMTLLMLNTVWLSLIIAVYSLKYRDMPQLITLLLQTAMFVTPILWPESVLTSKNYYLVDYNPLFHWVNIPKAAMLGESLKSFSVYVGVITAIIGIPFSIFIYSINRKKLTYWF